MKVELVSYVHMNNGLTLELIPEGEMERKLLAGFWKHGKMQPLIGGKFLINVWRSTTKDEPSSS